MGGKVNLVSLPSERPQPIFFSGRFVKYCEGAKNAIKKLIAQKYVGMAVSAQVILPKVSVFFSNKSINYEKRNYNDQPNQIMELTFAKCFGHRKSFGVWYIHRSYINILSCVFKSRSDLQCPPAPFMNSWMGGRWCAFALGRSLLLVLLAFVPSISYADRGGDQQVMRCSYINADLAIVTEGEPCIVETAIDESDNYFQHVTFRTGASLNIQADGENYTINGNFAQGLTSQSGWGYQTKVGELFLFTSDEATQHADNFDDAVKKYPELWDSLEPSESRTSSPQNTAQGEVYHAATGFSFALMQKVETNNGPQNHIFYRNEDGYGGIDQIIDLDHDGIDELIVSTLPGCNICEIFTTWMIFARDEDGLFQERISDIQFKPEIKYDEDNIAYFEGRALPDAGGSGYAEINTAHSFYEKYVYESYNNAGRVEYRENEYLKTEVELELRALFDRDEAEESFNAIGEQQIQYSDGSNDYNLQCEVRHWSIMYNIGNCTLNGVALDPDTQNPKWTCARIGFVAPKSDDEELRLVCNGNQTEDVATLLKGAQ